MIDGASAATVTSELLPTARVAPVGVSLDPDYDEKLAELNRFVADDSLPLYLRQIVKFLGLKTLEKPKYRASAEEICQGIGWTRENAKVEDGANGRLRTQLHQARKYRIKDFYAQPSSLNKPFRIFLPYEDQQEIIAGGKPYALRFVDLRAVCGDQGEVKDLWQRMVHGIDSIREVVLVYDTPNPPMLDPVLDETGLWSGSGEVAAAFSIGQYVAHLEPRVRLQALRWCDIGHLDNLAIPWRCLIVLGTSLTNKWIEHLHDREKLRGRQVFHFEDHGDKGGKRGLIRKMGRQQNPDEREIFAYVEASGSLPAKEYALVSFFRDSTNLQVLITLRGLTTVGSFAAAKFMCTDQGVEALKEALKDRYADRLPSFEMLLRVEIGENNTLGKVCFHSFELHIDRD